MKVQRATLVTVFQKGLRCSCRRLGPLRGVYSLAGQHLKSWVRTELLWVMR